MRGPLSVLAGLVLGAVVAALLLAAMVAFVPEADLSTPSPVAIATPATAPTSEPSSTPSPAPSVQPSPSVASAATGVASSPSGSPGLFHIGEPAPALSVPQVGGGTIELANLKGQPVWVDFVATACPSCQVEFPLMNDFANRYAKNGLVVIAVDVREDEGAVSTFAEGLGATFPIALDADGSAATAWNAVNLPVHFWIDKDGIVRDGALGGIGADVMARGLQTILPGVTVTP